MEYQGKDLEAMTFAEGYHRWIVSLLRPYLGKYVVEVGAGTGSFSKLLLEAKPELLALVEPSGMFEKLSEEVTGHSAQGTRIELFNEFFTEAAEKIAADSKPDTIVYVNVLEHIEDDARELDVIRETIADNGHLCIFVPACEFLYSDFDRDIGHFRRYEKKGLLEKIRNAGFAEILVRHFDFVGIVPWYVKYRLLRSKTMEPSLVKQYDQLVTPISRRLEGLMNPPIGKNILLVAKPI